MATVGAPPATSIHASSQSSSSSQPHIVNPMDELKEAQRLAGEAVQEDEASHYPQAIALYRQAMAMMKAQLDKVPGQHREALANYMASYQQRITALESELASSKRASVVKHSPMVCETFLFHSFSECVRHQQTSVFRSASEYNSKNCPCPRQKYVNSFFSNEICGIHCFALRVCLIGAGSSSTPSGLPPASLLVNASLPVVNALWSMDNSQNLRSCVNLVYCSLLLTLICLANRRLAFQCGQDSTRCSRPSLPSETECMRHSTQ